MDGLEYAQDGFTHMAPWRWLDTPLSSLRTSPSTWSRQPVAGFRTWQARASYAFLWCRSRTDPASAQIQCGKENARLEFWKVGPIGSPLWRPPQPLFSHIRRRAEVIRTRWCCSLASPVPQAPVYLHCCP